MYSCHHYILPELFYPSKKKKSPTPISSHSPFSSLPSPCQPLIYSCSYGVAFSGHFISKWSFVNWLLSLSVMFSSRIHVVIARMDIPSFLYLFISWYTCGSFPLWVITDNADVNFCVQVFVWTCIFSYLGCVSKSGIAGLCRNCSTVRGTSTAAAPFPIPTSSGEASSFSSSSPTFVIVYFSR